MFVSIAQIECMLTPRLSEEFKWGFFVNWRGGEGHNVEDDLAQEIQNRLSKSIVQRMGPNKPCIQLAKSVKLQTASQKWRSSLIDLPAYTSLQCSTARETP